MTQPQDHLPENSRRDALPNESFGAEIDFEGASVGGSDREDFKRLDPSEIPELPIDSRIEEIVESVQNNRVTILQAETGAGKTLRVPRALAEAGYKTVVTEPRIIAAKGSAARAAEEHGSELGSFVGYRTALYRNDSPDTQLLYCTDGLELIRTVMSDGEHRDVLVIDEVHEWNQHMEILLAWAKRELSTNPDFRVVIMSATMDHEDLSSYFDEPNVIEVEGRTFPVEEKKRGPSVEEDVRSLVREGHNVLVFQPGKKEIEDTIARLRHMRVDAEILPLHGSLSMAEQDRVFEKYDRPVVVVATNVAQTSLTLPYIDAVVDTGLSRNIEIVDGYEGLYKNVITQADREQRKGRAGRTKPGIFIDHCPVPAEEREKFGIPEILRIRPDQVVLTLLHAGIDIEELNLYHQPSKPLLRLARKTLYELGAIDKNDQITELGEVMADMPVSPTGARILFEALERGVLAEIIPAVAILEAGSITKSKETDWKVLCKDEEDSELLAQANILNHLAPEIAFVEEPDEEAISLVSARWGLDGKALRRAIEMLELLLDRFDPVEADPKPSKNTLLKSLAAGMVGNVYKQSDPEKFPRWYTKGDDLRELTLESGLKETTWVAGKPFDLDVGLDLLPQVIKLLTRAQRINPSWLPELSPHLAEVSQLHSPTFAVKKGEVFFQQDVSFNEQKIKTQYVADPEHPESAKVFSDWLAKLMLSADWDTRANKYSELKKVWEQNREIIRTQKLDLSPEELSNHYRNVFPGQSGFGLTFNFQALLLQ